MSTSEDHHSDKPILEHAQCKYELEFSTIEAECPKSLLDFHFGAMAMRKLGFAGARERGSKWCVWQIPSYCMSQLYVRVDQRYFTRDYHWRKPARVPHHLGAFHGILINPHVLLRAVSVL